MNEIYTKNVLEKFQSVEWNRQQVPSPKSKCEQMMNEIHNLFTILGIDFSFFVWYNVTSG
jgi:hypothetical protein